MKLTDYALIFLAIIIPMIVIVFVQISYVTKAEQQEMYYRGVVSTALTDATVTMKKVENTDLEVDYGYSGQTDNKISVNAQIGIDTFFSTMYKNMGIGDNLSSQYSFNKYIPVVAVIDYDGIYVHSAEETAKTIEYVTKPKRYFTYRYCIKGGAMVELPSNTDILDSNDIIYEINFTQDDYVYLTLYTNYGKELFQNTISGDALHAEEFRKTYTKAFYLEDELNNQWLVGTTTFTGIASGESIVLKGQIITRLKEIRKKHIATICMQEVSAALNKYNQFASALGMNYTYKFDVDDNSWYNAVGGVGIVALVQGINLGNKYLNYMAYNNADLQLTQRYYFSDRFLNDTYNKYFTGSTQYYHASTKCPMYEAYVDYVSTSGTLGIVPQYTYSKIVAAKSGLHVCPICKP